MSDNTKAEKLNTDPQDVEIQPGDCFGWYSHVSSDCHASSCIKSEWCKSYTLNRANQSENSIKRDLDEIGKDSSDRIQEGKSSKVEKKSMEELGKQAFFDKFVQMAGRFVKHDRINYNPQRNAASIKVGGRVAGFLSLKRKEVRLELGGRNADGPLYSVPIGESFDVIEKEMEKFIEEHS